jgi:hypothetical protein
LKREWDDARIVEEQRALEQKIRSDGRGEVLFH